MVKMALVLGLTFLGGLAHSEEKTCAVKGMHCADCAQDVQTKVCDQSKFSICDVKLVDKKKQVGQLHMITKDKSAKIDETAIGAVITDAGYTLDKCSMPKSDTKTGV